MIGQSYSYWDAAALPGPTLRLPHPAPSALQLSAVIDRLLAQPVTAPLKAMLTGVELLLAKGQVGVELQCVVRLHAHHKCPSLFNPILLLYKPCLTFARSLPPPQLPQLWEETAARHVSLAPQLAPLSALATRWRRLELAAWRGLLDRTRQRAAEVAHQVCGRLGCWIAGADC